MARRTVWTRRDWLRLVGSGSAVFAGGPLLAPRLAGRSLAQQTAELLIRGGRVVNADGVREADVRVRGERIAEVGPALVPGRDARVIDADGLLVMPGGIDPHTHLHPPFVDDLASGTASAAAGGITTVGTFAFPQGADETPLAAVDRMAAEVQAGAIGDVVLHSAVWPWTEEYAALMPALAERGQPSIKVYMLRRDFDARLRDVVTVLEAAARAGVLTMIHCEDWAVLDGAARRLEATGRTSLAHYAASRPVLAEVVATQRAVALCETTGAPMQVVHLSSARALAACRNPHTTALPLTVEVRPMYLHLTEERLAGEDGPLYVGQPPLRTSEDAEALWRGLADGSADLLATDHAPWTRAQKLDPALTIRNLRPGVADLRFMLPMYFSAGVRSGRISLERFVATTSTNAARALGLYPAKGVIAPGADADVVLFDPNRTGAVRAADDPSRSDYTVYEGLEVTGWPILTLRRGEVIAHDGRVTAKPGSGRLAARRPVED